MQYILKFKIINLIKIPKDNGVNLELDENNKFWQKYKINVHELNSKHFFCIQDGVLSFGELKKAFKCLGKRLPGQIRNYINLIIFSKFSSKLQARLNLIFTCSKK